MHMSMPSWEAADQAKIEQGRREIAGLNTAERDMDRNPTEKAAAANAVLRDAAHGDQAAKTPNDRPPASISHHGAGGSGHSEPVIEHHEGVTPR
jgi:hypothetical protein